MHGPPLLGSYDTQHLVKNWRTWCQPCVLSNTIINPRVVRKYLIIVSDFIWMVPVQHLWLKIFTEAGSVILGLWIPLLYKSVPSPNVMSASPQFVVPLRSIFSAQMYHHHCSGNKLMSGFHISTQLNKEESSLENSSCKCSFEQSKQNLLFYQEGKWYSEKVSLAVGAQNWGLSPWLGPLHPLISHDLHCHTQFRGQFDPVGSKESLVLYITPRAARKSTVPSGRLYSKHPTSSILRHLVSLQHWVPKLRSYYVFAYSSPLGLATQIVNANSLRDF